MPEILVIGLQYLAWHFQLFITQVSKLSVPVVLTRLASLAYIIYIFSVFVMCWIKINESSKEYQLDLQHSTSKFLWGLCISFQHCCLHFSWSQPCKHFRGPLLIHVIIQSDASSPMWYHIRCCYLIRFYKHQHDKLIKPPAISCTASFKGLQCRLSSCCCLDLHTAY